jgi:hypothetical protein
MAWKSDARRSASSTLKNTLETSGKDVGQTELKQNKLTFKDLKGLSRWCAGRVEPFNFFF